MSKLLRRRKMKLNEILNGEERQKNADNRRSNRGGGRSKMGSGDIRGGPFREA